MASPEDKMVIALASDHAGLTQASELEAYLKSLGHSVQNFGPKSFNRDDDYPDFVAPAAKAVASRQCEAGIIIGGSGQGEAMAANRIKGVRCAVFYGPAVPRMVIDIEGRTSRDPYEIVRLSREHNNANMLSFGARFTSLEEIKRVTKLWLETPFPNAARHERRILKMDKET